MAASVSLSQVAGNQLAAYEALYAQADSKGTGIVGALDAATFLKKSGLNAAILAKVWALSDPGGKGYLDKLGIFSALKYIALSQNGKEMLPANLTLALPAPNIALDGSPARTPLGSDSTLWAIPVSEQMKYDQIFDSLQPVNDLLTGDQVKPVLLKSNLPVDVLGRVWDMSDIDKDSKLDRLEFSVAMHLVYRALDKQPVPTVLPLNLIPPSKRQAVMAGGGVLAATYPTTPLHTPISTSLISTDMPTSPGKLAMPETGVATDWVVSAAEQLQYRDMFIKTDTDNDGLVNGSQLKDIFIQSRLPQPILAHIWNLCDTHESGQLNCEEFTLAMHLVQEATKGNEPPQQLTAQMIPPCRRQMEGPSMTSVTGMGQKELETLGSEIDELKKSKMKLEQEKAQRDADLKIRNGDVLTLQKEYDAVSNTLKMLESQKAEAQKRLDELNDKRTQLEKSVEELKGKCIEEEKEIQNLKMKIMNQENNDKNHEEEMNRMRDELGGLRQQELELEQQVQTEQGQLDELTASLTDTTNDINQTKASIRSLQEESSPITNGNRSTTPLTSLTPVSDLNHMSTKAVASNSPLSSLSDFSFTSGPSDDPFKSKDPFAKDNGVGDSTDPFHGTDPFKQDDPFKGSDPFKGENFGEFDPFGGDPFKDKGGTSSSSTAFSEDPFASDPFGSGFATARPTTATNDPFAPSHSTTTSDTSTSLAAISTDPFGTDLFAPSSPSARRNKSPAPPRPKGKVKAAPTLPPKQKKAPPPPRPPAPKPSPQFGHPAKDPFEGADPFGGWNTSSSEPVSGFADFSSSNQSPLTVKNAEEDALQQATRISEQTYNEQQRLRQQEQADLELAIALSKASMK